MSETAQRLQRAWALLLVRQILGLIFLMAGIHKCFQMGALKHAEQLFVTPYAHTFLPRWSLWATGAVIPWIELGAGGLVLIGWRRRGALIALGMVLVVVTFGHLLTEPFYEFHSHVIPRLGLLVFVLLLPAEDDRFSLDVWLSRRRSRSPATATADRSQPQ